MKHRSPLLVAFQAAAVFGATAFALPAQALLIDPVQVQLIAPGGFIGNTAPVSLSEPLTNAAPIISGGLGGVAGFMLPDEMISLVGDSIHIRVAQGDDNVVDFGTGGTGYLGTLLGGHARYELSGLAIAGRTITGFTAYAFDGFAAVGFSGVVSGAGISLVDTNADTVPDQLVFNLDELLFSDRGFGASLNYAEFRIDIQSVAAIPEPATWAMGLAGLLIVGAAKRRAVVLQRV